MLSGNIPISRIKSCPISFRLQYTGRPVMYIPDFSNRLRRDLENVCLFLVNFPDR